MLLRCCLWGRGQRENSAAGLLLSNALFKGLSCETGSFSYCHNHCSPQPPLSPLKSVPPAQPAELGSQPPRSGSPLLFWVGPLPYWSGGSGWFFNFFVGRVPCNLIFWRFWLFINFRLVIILLLVVRGNEGSLPTPPPWLELPVLMFFILRFFVFLLQLSQFSLFSRLHSSHPHSHSQPTHCCPCPIEK